MCRIPILRLSQSLKQLARATSHLPINFCLSSRSTGPPRITAKIWMKFECNHAFQIPIYSYLYLGLKVHGRNKTFVTTVTKRRRNGQEAEYLIYQ
ncbi:hypothetical protein BT96DRAFT_690797 [Gymnopus androsaceus JB14]|uniref:Uncharacterized protein n=1 Tax=Gymnopus androsaceus JB14 TaxID=1447944 RepID=A0A6A4HKF1_9AGAR|nr:hypothetical protein BT96DRAFT_690797 [Gymnopus androsaceus JB14]